MLDRHSIDVAETLSELQTLRDRVESMVPEACGNFHEILTVNAQRAGKINEFADIPFCSPERRIHNPACAHCMIGIQQRMKDLLPQLVPAIEIYAPTADFFDKKANPFAVEVIKATELGVFHNRKEADALARQAIEAIGKEFNKASARNDERGLDQFYNEEKTIKGIFEKGNVGACSIMLQDYVKYLALRIKELDNQAAEEAENGTYDFEKTKGRQLYIVEQLESLKQFLLDAIDTKMADTKGESSGDMKSTEKKAA